MNGRGEFVVVWHGPDDDDDGVFSQRFDVAGHPVGSEFRVNRQQDEEQWFADVVMGAAGNFAVFWEWAWSALPGEREIMGKQYDASGAVLDGEFQVNSYTPDLQIKPEAAVGGNGNTVVVWTSDEQDGSNTGVFGQLYDASGAVLGGEFQVNTYTTDYQRYPVAAADASGNFVVVWESYEQDGEKGGVFGQLYDAAGVPRGGEFAVNTNTGSSERGQVVAMDPGGNFVVVWSGAPGIAGQRFDASGQPLGIEFLVSPSGIEPAVASDATGAFVVAWADDGPVASYSDIFARQYAPDGTPLTTAFQVNSYTTYTQFRPDVASSADGDFVVVWGSYVQDGDSVGVFGQRYVGPSLHLSASGTCPGPVTVSVLNAPPDSEVGVVAAMTNTGWVKGGVVCHGASFEIGEPFQLPPIWVRTDAQGAGTGAVVLEDDRCWLEALAASSCETSGAVPVPSSP